MLALDPGKQIPLRDAWKATRRGICAVSTLQFKYLSVTEMLGELSGKQFHLELNLTPFFERDESASQARQQLLAEGHEVLLCDGGWCDFFPRELSSDQWTGLHRQVDIAHVLDSKALRLFFGRTPSNESVDANELVIRLQALCDLDPSLLFLMETHDQRSSDPQWVWEVLSMVDRQNIGLVFDPANVIRVNRGFVNFDRLEPFICHVHLKGLDDRFEYSGFHARTLEVERSLDNLGDMWSSAVEMEGRQAGSPAALFDAFAAMMEWRQGRSRRSENGA